ncbi:MAG TPA: hypothetical protein DD723_02540 [Candidatus Omnitrophica bacterium]|nr:MAG: hypothetical protein A2Z81_01740 [Omnitrophica WOR_2 bacterium GWA2_45_18]HBR14406.1 hypothetical protein [Candidatus Omnitrophota bacterium]
MLKPKREKKKLQDDPAYQKLVENLRRIIDDAAAKGIDLFPRWDILECRACKAYEDDTTNMGRVVCAGPDTPPVPGEFIILDWNERTYHRGRITYCKTTYDFICSVCGVQQQAFIRNRYED